MQLKIPQVLVLCALVFMAGCFSETIEQPEETPTEINGYDTAGATEAQLETMREGRVGEFMPQGIPSEVERVLVKITAAVKMGKPATAYLSSTDTDFGIKVFEGPVVVWREGDSFHSVKFTADDDQPTSILGDDDAVNYRWLREFGHQTYSEGDASPLSVGASHKAGRDVPPSFGTPYCVGVPLCKGSKGEGFYKCIDACGDTFYMVQYDLVDDLWACVSGGGGCVHECTGFAGQSSC